jgi:flagella basal body P-ring formation protein FlgA
VTTFAGTVAIMALLAAASLGAQSPSGAASAAASVTAVAPMPAIAPALGTERTVPIATRALARGATLTPADYRIASVAVRSALKSAAAAESGWVTRRPVAVGEPLVEPAVGPPALVAAGQPVTFVVEHESIRLTVRGTAASAGSLGERVWVRLDSGRRLRGLVTAPATVRADTTTLR